MASNPPGECCTRGVKHQGAPSGKLTKASDGKIDVYIAEAKGDNKKDAAILYIADIFGIYNNSKLLADSFAAEGYTTAVIDIFNGDPCEMPLPEGFDLFGWIEKGSDGQNPHTTEAIDPIIVTGIETLKSLGFSKIGAVGYCFGAKYVVRHYKNGIDVGFTAHPSFVTEEELAAITGPLSIAAAEKDVIFPVEQRQKSEEILRNTKVPWQINLFSGVEHGFAVRGDLNNPAVKFAQNGAFNQAVAWFDQHLVSPKSSL